MVWTLLDPIKHPLSFTVLPFSLTASDPRGPYPAHHPEQPSNATCKGKEKAKEMSRQKKRGSGTRKARREKREKRVREGPVKLARASDGKFVRPSTPVACSSEEEKDDEGGFEETSKKKKGQPRPTPTKAELAGSSRTVGGSSRRRSRNAWHHLADLGAPSFAGREERREELIREICIESEAEGGEDAESVPPLPATPTPRPPPTTHPFTPHSTPLSTPSLTSLLPTFSSLPPSPVPKFPPTTWPAWRTLYITWKATERELERYDRLLRAQEGGRAIGKTLKVVVPVEGRGGSVGERVVRVSSGTIKSAVWRSVHIFSKRKRLFETLERNNPELARWLNGEGEEPDERAPGTFRGMEKYVKGAGAGACGAGSVVDELGEDSGDQMDEGEDDVASERQRSPSLGSTYGAAPFGLLTPFQTRKPKRRPSAPSSSTSATPRPYDSDPDDGDMNVGAGFVGVDRTPTSKPWTCSTPFRNPTRYRPTSPPPKLRTPASTPHARDQSRSRPKKKKKRTAGF